MGDDGDEQVTFGPDGLAVLDGTQAGFGFGKRKTAPMSVGAISVRHRVASSRSVRLVFPSLASMPGHIERLHHLYGRIIRASGRSRAWCSRSLVMTISSPARARAKSSGKRVRASAISYVADGMIGYRYPC